ncbi:MAG: hypothetical protein U9P90_01540 [Patescibacteria group bacterium]|nr:hypothetical protein [Patescibacteria group bacterium]
MLSIPETLISAVLFAVINIFGTYKLFGWRLSKVESVANAALPARDCEKIIIAKYGKPVRTVEGIEATMDANITSFHECMNEIKKDLGTIHTDIAIIKSDIKHIKDTKNEDIQKNIENAMREIVKEVKKD